MLYYGSEGIGVYDCPQSMEWDYREMESVKTFVRGI